jgi:hypothetical protein
VVNIADVPGLATGITVSGGANQSTAPLVAGNYTARATSLDGQPVPINDNETFAFAISEPEVPFASVTATVENRSLNVTNPNNRPVVVNVTNDTDIATNITVSSGESQRTAPLTAGNYTASAASLDGESVPINDNETFAFSVDLLTLNATVENRSLNVTNPNDRPVVVNVTNDTGLVTGITVSGGANQSTAPLVAGNYTARATSLNGQPVSINDNETFPFTVELLTLNVTVENETIDIENPNGVAVTVSVTNDTGPVTTVEVAARDTETLSGLAPGSYTLTATADNLIGTLNDEEQLVVELRGSVDTVTPGTATETPPPVETETPVLPPTETPPPAETETPLLPPTETPPPAETETPVPFPPETPLLPPETETPPPVETETPPPVETETETPLPPETETPAPTPTTTPAPSETPTQDEPVLPAETPAPVETQTPDESPPPVTTTEALSAVVDGSEFVPEAVRE